ncbi:MAG: DUF4332 domain-containing protein [Spirochaetales bacterium]|nr:DUF4332 domain-containing protein [Spirochaetales bacterium]
MNYYLDAEKISLKELQKRIEETDLVPSRSPLLENIKNNFEVLKKIGYVTFADLRRDLKNAKNIPSISKKSGIDSEYLTLLRREIESYFPKAYPISSFDWLPKENIEKLEKQGYKNTALVFNVLNSSKKRAEISSDLGIETQFIDTLYCLVNLTRIQWVSPIAARILVSAGYKDEKSVAEANAEKMCDELDKVNKENNFFKGKIGLRDIKRLIKAASYVS